MHVNVYYNGHQDGDWIEVIMDGYQIFAGHSLGPDQLVMILKATQGFEFIKYHDSYNFETDQDE